MRLLLLNVFLLYAIMGFAQRVTDAEQLFNTGKFEEASAIYEQALKKKPKDGALNFKYARCLYELKRGEDAITYFQRALDNGFLKASRFLGDIYLSYYRFSDAVVVYETWINSGKLSSQEQNEVQDLLAKAQLGVSFLSRIEDIAVIDSVVLPRQKFMSVMRVPSDNGRIAKSIDFVRQLADSSLYAFESGRQDRRYLALPVEKQSDLFLSYKLVEEWSDPVSLSSLLNTSKNENFPFVAADGITIYFGSEGHEGLGGYDIFMSRYNSSSNDFLPPQNVGFPFNSLYNDYMMAFDEWAGIGWFVTDRFQPADSVVVYTFQPNVERMILRDKTDDFLRDAARMWRYRKSERANTAEDNTGGKAPAQLVAFVVNDSVVYYSDNQFLSDEARAKFLSLCDLKSLAAQKTFMLDATRDVWEIAETETDRLRLANEIMSMEQSLLLIEQQIKRYEEEVRSLEIIKLSSN